MERLVPRGKGCKPASRSPEVGVGAGVCTPPLPLYLHPPPPPIPARMELGEGMQIPGSRFFRVRESPDWETQRGAWRRVGAVPGWSFQPDLTTSFNVTDSALPPHPPTTKSPCGPWRP